MRSRSTLISTWQAANPSRFGHSNIFIDQRKIWKVADLIETLYFWHDNSRVCRWTSGVCATFSCAWPSSAVIAGRGRKPLRCSGRVGLRRGAHMHCPSLENSFFGPTKHLAWLCARGRRWKGRAPALARIWHPNGDARGGNLLRVGGFSWWGRPH